MGVSVMTPNILEVMKAKFTMGSVMDYTWIDLGQFDWMSDEEFNRVSDTVPELLGSEPNEVMLPFESVGFVRKTSDDAVLGLTIQRGVDSIVAVLRTKHGDVGSLLSKDGKTFFMPQGQRSPEDYVKAMLEQNLLTEETLSKYENATEFLAISWGAMITQQYIEYMRRVMDKEKYVKAYRPRPSASNAKRIRKGKRPIFEWKVIDVTAKVEDAEPTTSHGTHASPRRHKRRGHYRHYMDGRKVWIKEMMVGRIEFGYIHHSYEAKETNKC